jgi:hypothetical protein
MHAHPTKRIFIGADNPINAFAKKERPQAGAELGSRCGESSGQRHWLEAKNHVPNEYRNLRFNPVTNIDDS